MSRQPRNEVGLNIACRDHPTEILFWPRMSLDESRRLREAGPQGVSRGVTLEGVADPLKMSRRCPRSALGDPQHQCPVKAEFQVEKVRIVMVALAEWRLRGVWTVTDHEMSQLVRRPSRAREYLLQRAHR